MLHDAGAIVTGVDIYGPAVEYAKQYYSGPCYLKRDLNEIEGEYGMIVSFETLEHLYDPKLILQKFRQKCERLVTSVPNEEFYHFNPTAFEKDEYPHLRHWTPSEFEELLQSAGFEIKMRKSQKDKNSNLEDGTKGMFMIYVCS